jgi:antitoxin component YwqK of YwqJK toxin-antitoxin module
MLAYTTGSLKDGSQLIVTIEIPTTAITNVNRQDIVDKRHATYRSDTAIVKNIEDHCGNEYSNGFIDFSYYNTLDESIFECKIGDVIKRKIDFPERSMGNENGIYFWLHKDVIQEHIPIKNGDYCNFDFDGKLQEIGTKVDGKHNGSRYYWENYDDGCRHYRETHYHENHHEVLDIDYYDERIIKYEVKNDMLHGLFTKYDINNNKLYEVNYIDGKKEGVDTRWDSDGNIVDQITYENGKERLPSLYDKLVSVFSRKTKIGVC